MDKQKLLLRWYQMAGLFIAINVANVYVKLTSASEGTLTDISFLGYMAREYSQLSAIALQLGYVSVIVIVLSALRARTRVTGIIALNVLFFLNIFNV